VILRSVSDTLTKIFLVLAAVLCLTAHPSFGQDTIEQSGHYYYYETGIIKRNQVKKLILATEDTEAIRQYRTFQYKYWGGTAVFVTGVALIGFNLSTSVHGFTPSPYMVVGIATGTLGAILLASSNKNLDVAITRFNELQGSNLRARLSTNGLGLVYSF